MREKLNITIEDSNDEKHNDCKKLPILSPPQINKNLVFSNTHKRDRKTRNLPMNDAVSNNFHIVKTSVVNSR